VASSEKFCKINTLQFNTKNKTIRTFLLSKLGYSFLYKRLPNRIAGLRIRDKHKTSVKELLCEFIRRVFKEHIFKLKITELVNIIDWKRTLAFAPDWYYIFINADWNSKKFRKNQGISHKETKKYAHTKQEPSVFECSSWRNRIS